jgi:hypothetical protein
MIRGRTPLLLFTVERNPKKSLSIFHLVSSCFLPNTIIVLIFSQPAGRWPGIFQ